MYIESLLDTDFYEFLMQQVFVNKYADVTGKFKFKCRNRYLYYESFKKNLHRALEHLFELRFTNDEIEYLANIQTKSGTYLFQKNGDSYLEFLRNFRLNSDYLNVYGYNNELQIEIEGPLRYTSIFEVYLLRIISSINSISNGYDVKMDRNGINRLYKKIDFLKNHNNYKNPVKFADFGTRRAYDPYYHRGIVEILKNELPDNFVGTSNVLFAKELNLTPIGTMAHKFIQMFQGLDTNPIDNSQIAAFQSWSDFYRGDMGIALTDTLGNDKFFKDFDLYFAKLFDGVRNDSGDPFEWGNRMLNLYRKFNIDPKSKTLVFSNGLDFETMVRINGYFSDDINVSFGIGTNLTNDTGIVTPLNIVLKLIEVNGKPVAKLSEDKGKIMCEDDNYLNYLQNVCKRR